MKVGFLFALATLFFLAPMAHAFLGFIWMENNSDHTIKARYTSGHVKKLKPKKSGLMPTKKMGICFVEQDGWPSTDSCIKFPFATKVEVENDPIGAKGYKARGVWSGSPGKWKDPWGSRKIIKKQE